MYPERWFVYPDDVPWTRPVQPDATLLLLVRHGQTAWNAQRRFLGRADIPLDETGLRQAADMGSILGQGRPLYSSPALRARQTAAALGEPELVDGLSELDQGDLEGLDGPTAFARYAAFFAEWERDPANARVPGGETLDECWRRSEAAIRGLLDRHRGEDLVVVSHQMVIATLLANACGAGLEHWREYRVGNTSVTALTVVAQTRTVQVRDWRPWA